MIKVLMNAVSVRGGGAETFLLGLLPELVSMENISYDLLISKDKAHLYQSIKGHLNILPVSANIIHSAFRRLSFEHITVNKLLFHNSYDVYFRADELLSPFVSFMRVPTIAVFHATQHMLIPKEVGDSPLRLFYLNMLKKITMKIATVPVAVSHHEHGELSGLYPFARDKIQVIYHGINHNIFHPPLNGKPEPLGHISSKRYILSVSDRHHHKNYVRLIKAYKLWCDNGGTLIDLVIIGRKKSDKVEKALQVEIAKSGYLNNIHMLDYIAHDKLPLIYQGALAYICPSTFETFGFTPLEAMACGIPVACSRFSCLPEICGSAAYYFEPFDIHEIAEAIDKIVNDSKLREKLIQTGLQRSAQYTWQSAAYYYNKLIRQFSRNSS